jgi:PTS system ascorbate-specific IIA component
MVDDLGEHLPPGSIRVRADARDWREAVRIAGEALAATGATDAAYTEEMIRAIEELGPYIVIAPGFALAHSRPSPAVHRAGLSWVTLATPVEFGNEANDPVRVVAALAAPDHHGHLELMAGLADVISGEGVLERIADASDEAELRALFTRLATGGAPAGREPS